MPLGKLEKEHIQKGCGAAISAAETFLQLGPDAPLSGFVFRYTVLSEIQRLLESSDGTLVGPTRAAVVDQTNKFYTIIPHDFGHASPTVIGTLELLKQKIELLDALMSIQISSTLLSRGSSKNSERDPIDMKYDSLKTDMQVVPHESDEFKIVEKYTKHTHGATHTQYTLDVVDVFRIEREGEAERYKPYANSKNRMLLWHGSRITNFGGILSQGLRIAPPEAPVTGYMFGKGVYFADMVSKSANYCFTSRSQPTGLMLLCDVALGDMYEVTQAEYVEKLPKGKLSTKGLGTHVPNMASAVTLDDGTVVPLGEGTKADIKKSSLLYNEYIVYDVSQIKARYLVQMKFSYK
jgi:poly [ADP-ribose] polymerase